MYQMMENEKECEEHKMVEKTMDKIVALAKSRGFISDSFYVNILPDYTVLCCWVYGIKIK